MLPRHITHYLIAIALLTIYGSQVCPFLDTLSVRQVLVPTSVAFILAGGVRHYGLQWISQQRLKHQSKKLFQLDLTLFLSVGVGLMIYNTLLYGFPLVSGLKVVLGTLVTGFMASCDLALRREYETAITKQQFQPDDDPYPISHKFAWFASVTLLTVLATVFLVVGKDLEWLATDGASIDHSLAQRYILAELGFVTAVFLSYALVVIYAYSRNLKLFLSEENRILSRVANGRLDQRVPVASNDEFGLMAQGTNQMIEQLIERNRELAVTRDATILALATLAETRDNETGAHIKRTQHYVRILAEALRDHERFCDNLDDASIDLLFKSAPLHDIGKVGIPDNILLKPGKLTDEEFAVMKNHPLIGSEALQEAEQQLGSSSFLRLAREISESHHEKWNGSGYPHGLSGDDIPLSGRLMALADVYDALISKRVYKPAFSHEKARGIIIEGSGNHFDPDIVEAFLQCEQQFIAIAAQYKDAEHQSQPSDTETEMALS